MKFLLWNLNNKDLGESIRNLALKEEIDIFVLLECSGVKASIMDLLKERFKDYFLVNNTLCEDILIITKFPANFLTPVEEGGRITMQKVSLPAVEPFLLVAVHFISKLHWSEISQHDECIDFAESIIKIETDIGSSRTILVGDLNMNPFEHSLVSAKGFNAVMCKNIASKKTKTVQGKEYPFFYNPMWNAFGDNSPYPPGTYYYAASEHVNYYWNMFDQVLIRPDLISHFDNDSLRIIDSDGKNSFISEQGIPNSAEYSDHLPILFNLNL